MASRLRSRHVIWTIGSSPSCRAMTPAISDDIRTTAVWLSVMFAAST
jgi:hypothetical protein